MFINAYEFGLENEKGETINVSLRLGAGGQIKLKNKYNENTTTTLFGAMDDIEKLVDVLTYALTYTGNSNTIKDGAKLVDLMACNDMLGMRAKQKLITSIARASGIFDEEEKRAIDSKSDDAINEMLDEKKGKNQ